MKIPMAVTKMISVAEEEHEHYDLDGIHIQRSASGNDCVAMATNGLVAIVAAWPQCVVPEGSAEGSRDFRHLISREMIDDITFVVDTGSEIELREDAGQTSVVELEADKSSVTWTEVSESQDPPKYPNVLEMGCWKRLTEEGRRHWRVRPELLRQVAEAIDELTRTATDEDGNGPAVVLTLPETATDPLVLSALGPKGQKIAAVIMPVNASGGEKEEVAPEPPWSPAELVGKPAVE